MTETPFEKTPLGRLVLFMIGLSLLGIILGGVYHLAVDLPAQKSVKAPTNSYGDTGGIQIWSTPGDAYVEVTPANGNMPYGGWTNSAGSYTLSNIPAYVTYQITVTKGGYRPYTTTLYVNPHIIAETHPTLPADVPDPGTIDISVSPYGGTVCIDGGQCETYPLDTTSELSRQVQGLAGDQYHTVTVTLNGYRPFSQDVWVPAGNTGRVRVTLQRS
ncbi:carboxypeptidase-like regulatory domain-containing protein [uncultured Methanoregula sp.]|uniref:carboxypeptidase-like regulatory domain-containing protein n=1 Tax=uncultured Methanoregula sp. TaxID=1005933 RepID=UPI002AABB89E|nr:carboxypeptidase-like regulatory domain-containing protein [uncultured Methanoregula sp.]